jgi:pyruvate-ferredoxin/flavodoxin oxidoreductase
MRMALNKQMGMAHDLLKALSGTVGERLVTELVAADQSTEGGIRAQRQRVAELRQRLAGASDPRAALLLDVADCLIRRSVWIVGGDGWAYDIGYGGLDHVLALGLDVNLLVLDTEVYSNTGGQSSKSTPRGAVAKFAANGKGTPKKDLGMMAMAYGYVYVAKVAFGASDQHTLTSFLEAESYDGPSLIIAFSPCISHGYDLRQNLAQQQLGVKTGAISLMRYNPRLVAQGKNPLLLGSGEPKLPLEEYEYNETRFKMLTLSDEERAEELLREARGDVERRWDYYSQLAALHYDAETASAGPAPEED